MLACVSSAQKNFQMGEGPVQLDGLGSGLPRGWDGKLVYIRHRVVWCEFEKLSV